MFEVSMDVLIDSVAGQRFNALYIRTGEIFPLVGEEEA